MANTVLLDEENAQPYLEALDAKSGRIVKQNLRKLEDVPYPRPGSGLGDDEEIVYRGQRAYRMHVGRSHTAIYTVQESAERVLVHELIDIDDAHKRYGY